MPNRDRNRSGGGRDRSRGSQTSRSVTRERPATRSTRSATGGGRSNRPGKVEYGKNKVSSSKTRSSLKSFAKALGKTIVVTGGDRTKERNKQVGGARKSQHIEKDAADIKVKGMSFKELAQRAAKSGKFTGIGLYNDHVHVDNRKGNPSKPVRWTKVKETKKKTGQGGCR